MCSSKFSIFRSPFSIVLAAIALAMLLWTLMFSPWTASFIPFWPTMTVSALVLSTWAFLFTDRTPRTDNRTPRTDNQSPRTDNRSPISDLCIGIVITCALWGIFWVGDKASQWLFPSFARTQVNGIYGMKTGINPWLLSGLLLFIIGPAEELFWRGYVQKTLSNYFERKYPHVWGRVGDQKLTIGGLLGALIAIACYTLIHLFSLNFMLIMAALVCGVVWGGLFYLFPRRFPAILISHALWDAAVFVWFPI